MNSFLVVFATIVVAVNARAGRQGWGVPSGGWPAPTAPPPTAAPGWPAPAQAPTGWSAPPANNVVVAAAGDLAAAGNGIGWAASSQDTVLVGTNIVADTSNAPASSVSQVGVIAQTTLINPTDAVGVQTIDVNQAAISGQSLDTSILGGDLAVASFNGWAAAAGDASSSANGVVDVLINKP